MKEASLTRPGRGPGSKQPTRRFHWPNTMTFPRALRDAIPEKEPYAGRVLKLDAIAGQCQHSFEFGKRVLIRFSVRETGKLRGEFDVFADIDAEAARALAKSLEQLADQVERMPPESMRGRAVRVKR
jgi:hypothetical protein